MRFTSYGPGDLETCGPCMGHPHDPRTPEPCYKKEAFADWHAECFMNEFATSQGGAEAWLTSVGCGALSDSDGNGNVNELLRELSRGSMDGVPFPGSHIHWRIIRKLARHAFESGEWR